MFGEIFSESLDYGVGESELVIYAVVGDGFLQRLWYDYAGSIVFAFFVFRAHV